MLNIVIPMAGAGSRFSQAGYVLPKPLIPVNGTPMMELVISNIKPKQDHKFIFIVREDHIKDYNIDQRLREWAPGCEIVIVDRLTDGAACTVLLAIEHFNNDDQLMIANCDQWVDIDINDYLSRMNDESLDGLIMTMWADHPKWSYVGLNKNNTISRVVEKEVISNEATVGIYNYKRGVDFVNAAKNMIKQNKRVNNEFYVAPAYNEMLKENCNLAYYNVGKEYDGMYGLGTPEDVKKFEEFKNATN